MIGVATERATKRRKLSEEQAMAKEERAKKENHIQKSPFW